MDEQKSVKQEDSHVLVTRGNFAPTNNSDSRPTSPQSKGDRP